MNTNEKNINKIKISIKPAIFRTHTHTHTHTHQEKEKERNILILCKVVYVWNISFDDLMSSKLIVFIIIIIIILFEFLYENIKKLNTIKDLVIPYLISSIIQLKNKWQKEMT